MIYLQLRSLIVAALYFILTNQCGGSLLAEVGLQTQKGMIYGRETQSSIEYLGIQYAKVTRWKPPVDLSSEAFPNRTFNATSFGPCCPQPSVRIYIDRQDEQCLYLNIFTPLGVSNQSQLPVLVWIHGGALQTGCSSQGVPILYNGTNIIANSPHPAIIVTINYRLGVLADMYLPALAEENSPEWPTAGNYYYLDMLSALRWVNKNIVDYGGNPNNVLLFGQSSGANAVVDIGALKGSANLYQHIISESGGAGQYGYYSNVSDAIRASDKVVQNMNCTRENDASTLVCLRNASIQDLILAFGYRQVKPIIDGYFFSHYPPLAIKNGMYNPNITMMMGNNENEPLMCLESPDMNSTAAISMVTRVVPSHWLMLVTKFYELDICSSNRNATNRCCDVVRSLLIDKLFDCNVQRIYNHLSMKYQSSNKLFWYHLDCNPGICPILSTEEGAGLCSHVDEIPFVFGTISSYNSMNNHNCTWDANTRTFSNRIISHWISMASFGKPLQPWPQYSPTTKKYFQITPYHDFSGESWHRNCSLFDQLEDEQITLMFSTTDSGKHYAVDKFLIFLIAIYYMERMIANENH